MCGGCFGHFEAARGLAAAVLTSFASVGLVFEDRRDSNFFHATHEALILAPDVLSGYA